MANRAYVAIHSSEDMVVFRAGMSGGNERLHGFYRVLFGAKQFAIVIGNLTPSLSTREGEMPECLIRLREGGAVAFVHTVYLTLMPQAVRLRYNLLCLADRARSTSSKNTH